jgi:GWxTD domain-containing protein
MNRPELQLNGTFDNLRRERGSIFMKLIDGYIIILFILSIASFLGGAQEPQTQNYEEWLDLVDPIITKTERQVFLQLKNDTERNKFIHSFWKRRDTRPDTELNEFYRDYMERVRFADLHFGHDAPKPGHQTERGRFHLALGPPLERQRFVTESDLNPLELWHYRGEAKYGLPPFFYLIFYQPRGIGEYRLYSPGVEGPQQLVSPGLSDQTLNRRRAYQLIRGVSGELARASLSYIPGDSVVGETALSSASLIASINDLPEKKFSDAYARQFLYYKDFVETEYSHKFIDSRHLVKVFFYNGQPFMHWSLEPSEINFAAAEGATYASYQLNLRLEDLSGNPVLEREEEIPLTITPEAYRQHQNRLFAFQDMFPVIPGKHQLNFLLRNKTGQEFTSFNTIITVPDPDKGPVLSDVLVYQSRHALGAKQAEQLKAFAFNGTQYLSNAAGNTLKKIETGVFAQVLNLPADRYTLTLDIIPAESETGEPAASLAMPLEKALGPDGRCLDIYPLDLDQVSPGYYDVKLSVSSSRTRIEAKDNLILLNQPVPVIPWAYAKLHPAYPHPDYMYLTARQYFQTGQYASAQKALEQARAVQPTPRIEMLLARTLTAQKHFQESLELIIPLYEKTGGREPAKIMAADYAGLREWSQALFHLERLMKEASELEVINLAAQCYIQLDQPDKARPLIQKSLQINPDQESIKKLARSLEKLP